MTDKILISDLSLRTIIGINEDERRNRQDVLINITLEADTGPAGLSDDIQDAVNYRTITKRVIKHVEESSYYLVEKLAAEIAAICLEGPGVEAVTVRVEKPGALRFSRSVGVEISRSRAEIERQRLDTESEVFVSLGSNIDPERNLPEAVAQLATYARIVAVSPVYETVPVGSKGQANFLNAAVLLRTDLSAGELKSRVLVCIEEEMGRQRTADKYAPRPIDLDISLFDAKVLELDGRHIPDPEILLFPHIARPLADLAPSYCHPETGQTLLEIAKNLSDLGLQSRSDVVLQIPEA